MNKDDKLSVAKLFSASMTHSEGLAELLAIKGIITKEEHQELKDWKEAFLDKSDKTYK